MYCFAVIYRTWEAQSREDMKQQNLFFHASNDDIRSCLKGAGLDGT